MLLVVCWKGLRKRTSLCNSESGSVHWLSIAISCRGTTQHCDVRLLLGSIESNVQPPMRERLRTSLVRMLECVALRLVECDDNVGQRQWKLPSSHTCSGTLSIIDCICGVESYAVGVRF